MANLTLRKLAKSYENNSTVKSVDLTIESGEFIVLVGPSGCGKSTILRMIAGLEEVSSGDIFIDDDNVTHIAPSDRSISMVFQSYALYPHMSVRDNLCFGLKNMKCTKEHIEKQVNHAAQVLQITDYLQRLPNQLSGGQRQRVAIGRAIVRDPKIFLFDEPLSNLDAELRVQMRHELIKLHKKLRSTMIYVTHDQVEAMTMADRIVVLNEGGISQVGTPLQLYNDPDNLFTASFIGSPKINLLQAKVLRNHNNELLVNIAEKHNITLPMNVAGVQVNDTITVGIRPEHLSAEVCAGDIALEFSIDAVESLGDATYLYAKLYAKYDFRIKLQGQHQVRDAECLLFAVPCKHVLLFDNAGKRIYPTSPNY